MNNLVILGALISCALIGGALAGLQSVGVRGKLLCGNEIANISDVKLIDKDRGGKGSYSG